jgi:hypothetical protein
MNDEAPAILNAVRPVSPISLGKKPNEISGGPKAQDTYRGGICGPKSAIRAEVINARDWEEVVSPDGVVSYVSRIRAAALREGNT